MLSLPASTRAAALGGAFPIGGTSPDAVFHNPAAVSRAEGFAATGGRFGGAATLLQFSAAHDLWGGAAAFGLRSLAYATDADSPAALAEGLGDLPTGGARGASERVAVAAWGTRWRGVRLGGAAKAVELRLGGRKDAALAADLGLSVALGDLTLGFAARDLGGDFDLRPGRLDAGERLSLDASIDGVQAGPLDLAAAGTLTRERDGDYVPAAGFEAAYWPVVGRTFVVRAGVRRVPEGPARSWTLGGAVRLDGFTLDYAYQPFDGLDAAHRFSVVWR